MDKEQAIEKLNDIRCHVKETSTEEQALVMAIDALNAQLSKEGTTKGTTSAQPKVIIGHWIQYDKIFPWRYHYKCSECGNYLDFTGVNGGRGEANFCPNCGAKMKGKTGWTLNSITTMDQDT